MTHIIVMAYISLAQISDFEEQTETVVINNLITEYNDSGNIILVKADITNKYYKTIGPIRVSLESRSKDGKFRRVEDKRVSNLSTGYPKSVEFNIPQDVDKENLSINVYYRTTLLSKMVIPDSQNIEKPEKEVIPDSQNIEKSEMNDKDVISIKPYSINEMLLNKITELKGVTEKGKDNSSLGILMDTLLHRKYSRKDPVTKIYKLDSNYLPTQLKEFNCELFVDSNSGLVYEIYLSKGGNLSKLFGISSSNFDDLDKLLSAKYSKVKPLDIYPDKLTISCYESNDNKDLSVIHAYIPVSQNTYTVVIYSLLSYSSKAGERGQQADLEEKKDQENKNKKEAEDL